MLVVLVALIVAPKLSAQCGTSMYFNGTNGTVDVPSSSTFTTLQTGTSVTWEAWIKIQAWSTNGVHNFVILDKSWRWEIYPTYSIFNIENGSNSGVGLINNNFNLNVWTHLAATYDKTSGVTLLYVNGTLVGSTTIATNGLNNNFNPLHIGYGPSGVVENSYGWIDDVRIWNSVRTQQQIQNNMNKCLIGNESGLIMYLPFDEGSGTTAFDKSPNGNNGTLSGGCNFSADIPSINCLPIANAGVDKIIGCSNGTSAQIGITATGGVSSSYTYSWSPSLGLSASNIAQPTASPSSTTQYIVTVTSGGCVGYDTVIVTVVNSTVVAIAPADQSICKGDSLLFTSSVSGGTLPYSYAWSPPIGLSATNILSPIASPSITTQYILLVTDAVGCQNRDTVNLIIKPKPTIFAGVDKEICNGSSIVIPATAFGGSGTMTYSWSPVLGLSNPSILQPVASPTTTTQYILTVNDLNGCSVKDTVDITVKPLPILTTNLAVALCLGNQTTISCIASGGTGAISYSWSPVNEIIGTNNTPQITVKPSITTNYIITVTDSKGCEKRDSVKITVNPKPKVNAGANIVICKGEAQKIGNLASGSNYFTYNWSPSSGLSSQSDPQPIANPTISTTYQVVATDENGCKDTSKIDVRVRQIATNESTSTLIFGKLYACEANKSQTFDITNTGTDDITFTKQLCTSTNFVMTDGLPFILAKGSTKRITVRFTPTKQGVSNDTLTLTGNPCDYSVKINLQGEKLQLAFTTDKANINYGVSLSCDTISWDSVVTIINTGTDIISINSIQIDPAFQVISPTFPQDISAKSSLAVKVRYAPKSVGSFNGELRLNFTAGTCSDTIRIALSGTHVIPDVSISPLNITFPDLLGCDPPMDTLVTITNANTIDVDVIAISMNNSQFKVISTLPLKLSAGQSKQIKLRFDPNINGAVTATMKVITNPCAREIIVQLKGKKQGVSFSSPDTLDIGILCPNESKDTSISLTNTGTVNDVLQMKSPNLILSSASVNLSPTENKVVTVRFTGRATVGAINEVLTITDSICGLQKNVQVVGVIQLPKFVAQPLIDYGSVLGGTSSILTAVAVNKDSRPITIAPPIGIVSPFILISLIPPAGSSLAPNDTVMATIRYDAVTGMQSKTTLIWSVVQPCTETDSTVLRGQGVPPSLTATPRIVFDSVCEGQSKSLSATITNNGNTALQLLRAEWVTNVGKIFTTTLSPQPLSVGGSITQQINFAPTASGLINAQVRWIADKDTTTSDVSGIGKVCSAVPDTTQTLVALKDITAQAGDKVNLILFIAQQKNMQVQGAPKNFTANIRYNPTMLFNLQTQNLCINNNVTDCQIEINGTIGSGNDLAVIPCVATLGSTDNSSLTLEDFRWTDGTVKSITQTQNGKITITGTCEQGGVRLYIPGTNATSLTTRPNPAQNTLQIQYGLREPLNVTLELVNMTGQVMQTIISNQLQKEGQYTINADLNLLGNGVYLLRLVTALETLTTRVDVVK